MGLPLDLLHQRLIVVLVLKPQFSVVLVLDAAQSPEVVAGEQEASNTDTRPRDNCRDSGGHTPYSVLRGVHVDQGGDQAGYRVHRHRPRVWD